MKKGHGEGEFTFIGGKGNMVIDYGIVNGQEWEEIEQFTVELSVDSDHAPICVVTKEEATKQEMRKWKNNEEKKKRSRRIGRS